jgi:hypothetical protein
VNRVAATGLATVGATTTVLLCAVIVSSFVWDLGRFEVWTERNCSARIERGALHLSFTDTAPDSPYRGVPALGIHTATVPLWIPATLIGLPTAWLIARLVRRLPRRGHCAACDYNLKGSMAGICPECGAAASLPKG